MFLKELKLLHEKIPNFNQYPFSIPSIKNLDCIILKSPIVFFVGENGTGKSTLLEAIADNAGFNIAGGSRNNTYEVYSAESSLGDYIRLSWLPKITNGFFFRAETFYHFATHIDQIDSNGYKSYGGKSLLKQSHGESFLSLFTNRFNQRAIYLLDEPEAALSPSRQLSFLKIINELTLKQNVQFIIATHSPILLGFPNSQIFSFDNEEICEISYEMTDHYQITKYFLHNREKILSELFNEDE